MTSSDKKLAKLYALFERTGSDGERLSALRAIERLEARMSAESINAVEEWTFTFPDHGSSRLFQAVCAKYGVKCYRYKGQRYTTVNISATDDLRETISREFEPLNEQWFSISGEILADLVTLYEQRSEQTVTAINKAK